MLKVLSPLVPVVLQTLVLYIFLIVALRLAGHRLTAQLSVVELVVVMVLGSAVETSLVDGNTSLAAGLASALTLLVCNRALTLGLERSKWLRRALVGRPVPVVYKGRFLDRRMQQVGLSKDDVREAMRERGYDDVKQVRLAMLELNGGISVVPLEDGEQGAPDDSSRRRSGS